MSITTAQIRGARGILDWSQSDLSQRTGISATSIGSIENNQSTPRASTLDTIRKAFENGGIEFIGTDGVRLRSGDVRVYVGQEGYISFFDEVYREMEAGYRYIYVSNVDERMFVKWHGELGDDHIDNMANVKDVERKILIREGDDFFPAGEFAEYRWIPKADFSSVPFYVFGRKLGIILFENEPKIIVLDYPAITDAYKKQFISMWENSIEPTIKKVSGV